MALDKDGGLGSAPGGAGSSTFDGLTDTPSDKTGQANKLVTVNNLETELEYTDPPAGVSINFLGGYIFDGASVGDSDPGAGRFRLNNVDHTLATFAFVSNTQEGGPDFSDTMVDIATGDLLSVMQRDAIGRADAFTLSGTAIAASGYFKLPITHISVGVTGGIVDAASCVLWVNPRGRINANTRSVDRIAVTEVVTPAGITLDAAPGVGLTFSYPSGDAVFIGENSLRTLIVYPAGVNVAIDGGLVDDLIVLTISIAGALEQYDTQLSPSLRRTTAQLGAIVRNSAGFLTFAFDPGQIEFQVLNKLTDLANAIGPFATRDIRVDTSGVANTSFKLFGGAAFSYDSSGNINDPSSVTVPTQNIANFEVYLSDGEIESTEYVGDSSNTLIQPDLYQPTPLGPVAAPLATIPGGPNQATIVLFFWQPGAAVPAIRMLPGQAIFASMTDAINGLETYSPTIPSRVGATAIPLGGAIMIKGAADFTSTTQVMFFRSTAINGGGAGTVAPTLGEVYANSNTQPQYLVNNVQNQIQVQDGVDDPTTVLYEFLNFLAEVQWRMTSSGLTNTGGTEPNLTGVQEIGGNPTIEPDNKTIRIPAGFGFITDFRTNTFNGVRTRVTWVETLFTIPDGTLSTDDSTYIFHNGTAFDSQATAPTHQQELENIFFCATINNTDTDTVVLVMPTYRLSGTTAQILNEYFRFKGAEGKGGAVSQTSDAGGNGDLALQITSADVFAPWINAGNDRNDMSDVNYPASDPIVFAYMLQDGDYKAGFSVINPTIYDNGSAEAQPVPNPVRNTTIQYLWKLITGEHVITLGQFIYADLAAGVTSIGLDRNNRVLPPILQQGLAFEMATIVVQKDCTSIAETDKIRISPSVNSASGSGGGAESFVSLTDTPGSYSGEALRAVRVNADANGLEFVDPTVVTTSVAPGATLVLTHTLNTANVLLSATYLDGESRIRDVASYPRLTTIVVPYVDFGTNGQKTTQVNFTSLTVNNNIIMSYYELSIGRYRNRIMSPEGTPGSNITISNDASAADPDADVAAIAAGAIHVIVSDTDTGDAVIVDAAGVVTTPSFEWNASTVRRPRCHELSDGNILITYQGSGTGIVGQVMNATGTLVGSAFTVTSNGNGTHYGVGCADNNVVFLYGDNVTGELAYRVQSNDLVTEIVTETVIAGIDAGLEQLQGFSIGPDRARFIYLDPTNGSVRYMIEISTAGEVTLGPTPVDPVNVGGVGTRNDLGYTILDNGTVVASWIGANGWPYFRVGDNAPVAMITQVAESPRVQAFKNTNRFFLGFEADSISAGRYQAAVVAVADIVIDATDVNTATLTNRTQETLTITLSASRY